MQHAATALVACLMFYVGVASSTASSPDATSCSNPAPVRAASGWTVDLACDASEAGQRVNGPARLLIGLPLDVNREDARALEVLPRIGPTRAAAIVAARENAAFSSLADLERIAGIGPVTVAGLEGLAVARPEFGAWP